MAGLGHDDARSANPNGKSKLRRRYLVQETAAKLRDLVFDREPGALIGSLPELARLLGVGIVTVQQAARILEHEGLLEVRRGPGGGYYGQRPDEAALERSLAAYLRMHPASYGEMLDITTLLFRELVAAAAACDDEACIARGCGPAPGVSMPAPARMKWLPSKRNSRTSCSAWSTARCSGC
jgi:DNA-binding GntR family transcriptional regulator